MKKELVGLKIEWRETVRHTGLISSVVKHELMDDVTFVNVISDKTGKLHRIKVGEYTTL